MLLKDSMANQSSPFLVFQSLAFSSRSLAFSSQSLAFSSEGMNQGGPFAFCCFLFSFPVGLSAPLSRPCHVSKTSNCIVSPTGKQSQTSCCWLGNSNLRALELYFVCFVWHPQYPAINCFAVQPCVFVRKVNTSLDTHFADASLCLQSSHLIGSLQVLRDSPHAQAW